MSGKAIIAWIIFALLLLVTIILLYKQDNFLNNALYAFLSALFGGILTVTIISIHDSDKRIRASKEFLLNFKLKAYSELIYIFKAINIFLKCEKKEADTIKIEFSCDEGNTQTGEKYKEVDTAIIEIDEILEKMQKIKKEKKSNEKRFDYYYCFMELVDDITPKIINICEFASLIHPDDYKLKSLFQQIISIKQNMNKLQGEIQVLIQTGREYDTEEKALILKGLELKGFFEYSGLLNCIMANVEELVLIIKNICLSVPKYKIKKENKSKFDIFLTKKDN